MVPGESDYLVRGLADARWLRHAAYAAVGLPRLADHPSATNRTALVVDREDAAARRGRRRGRARRAGGRTRGTRRTCDAHEYVVAAQVRLFERASLVSRRTAPGHEHALAREGAAVVELKQYGEYSTTFRDLAAVSRSSPCTPTPPNPSLATVPRAGIRMITPARRR